MWAFLKAIQKQDLEKPADDDGTDHRVLRFCFAKTDDTLMAAAERLCRI